VPDFKIEKWVIERRLEQLIAEGVRFEYGVDVGTDIDAAELRARHDAVVIATGSRVPRELEVPGRELDGVQMAMDYLYIRNRYVASITEGGIPGPEPEVPIVAEGKDVVVIGGGDTGMDCISNANREGANSAILLDVYPEIPVGGRYDDTPWPLPLKRSVTTYALDEGGERRFGTQVTQLRGDENGHVRELVGRKVTGSSSRTLLPVPESEFAMPADLVLIAVGFTGPERPLLDALGVERDGRGNVAAPLFASSESGVFACGDARVGQSLIVTAIAEGRRCARIADRWLAEGARSGAGAHTATA
jgi:glutamate synthase (NADPH/NADH) small chain